MQDNKEVMAEIASKAQEELHGKDVRRAINGMKTVLVNIKKHEERLAQLKEALTLPFAEFVVKFGSDGYEDGNKY